MNLKTTEYYNNLSDDDKLLASHVKDLIGICENKFIPRFTSFLDERQVELAFSVLNGMGHENYLFFGGFEQASRKILGIFPQYSECDKSEFPLKALVFRYRAEDKLSHRDFLGTFMAKQINRSMIGDIVVNDGYTVAFVYETVVGMLENEISKVGSIGVKLSCEENVDISINESFEDISATVASMRLDSIVSHALKLSREKSVQLIKSGNVTVSYNKQLSASTELKCGDVFSVRGYGKFIVDSIDGKTKKDRIRINIRKYI